MGAEQKVAIITGASQGIGEALVKGYRDRNFRVVASSRSIKPSSDPDILTVAGDIADPKTAERIVSQALERFGRIDTLVNNAGIFIAKPFTEYTDEDYANILNTNLKASSTSPGAQLEQWKSRARVTSCRLRRALSIRPTAASRRCSRR
jgi:NAD(P)-dependent dehydrogenase (short-subunit alcohol dehydrogenase family)